MPSVAVDVDRTGRRPYAGAGVRSPRCGDLRATESRAPCLGASTGVSHLGPVRAQTMDGGLATGSPHGQATDHLRAPGRGVGEDHADLHVVTHNTSGDPERVLAALPIINAVACVKRVNFTGTQGRSSRNTGSAPVLCPSTCPCNRYSHPCRPRMYLVLVMSLTGEVAGNSGWDGAILQRPESARATAGNPLRSSR